MNPLKRPLDPRPFAAAKQDRCSIDLNIASQVIEELLRPAYGGEFQELFDCENRPGEIDACIDHFG
jgi:hypothetical protein